MNLRRWIIATCCSAALLSGQLARAQAAATASGPGAYIAVGGGITMFQADYGSRGLGGGLVFADVNPQWRVGLEGEIRMLRWHTDERVTESNYLGGLRIALWRPRRVQPYGKLLAGLGKITLPFGYGRGAFLVYAPGAGVDVALTDRVSVRAIDFEYQDWPQFAYGRLNPYGFSAGVSVRLNPVFRYPKHRY